MTPVLFAAALVSEARSMRPAVLHAFASPRAHLAQAHHLTAAGDQSASPTASSLPAAAPSDGCLVLLDLALRDFNFVRQVFSVKDRGFRLVKDLGGAKARLADYSHQVRPRI
jgi:hypothetical protein